MVRLRSGDSDSSSSSVTVTYLPAAISYPLMISSWGTIFASAGQNIRLARGA
jgi:hypothetical protein